MTTQIAVTQWLAFLLCVGAGYVLGSRLPVPARPWVWLVLIAAIFVIGYLPFLAVILQIAGAPVQLNNLLWGFGIGAVINFMFRNARQRVE